MRARTKAVLVFVFAVCFAALLWHLTKGTSVAILQPKGLIAGEERNLIFIAAALMCLVVLPVFALTAIIAWKYRATNKSSVYRPNWEHNTLEEFIWWAIPCIIIVVLASITWKTTHELDPYKPIPGNAEKIQVIALNWKWLFIYPAEGVASVNEVVLPLGRPVEFSITADAPMNSFWIPQLGGQIYAMSGMVTKMHLIANEPGTYEGMSANLSGYGFSGMRFKAVGVQEQDFASWIESLKTYPLLDASAYERLATPSSNDPVRYYGAVQEHLFDSTVASHNSMGASDSMRMPEMNQ